MRSLLPDSSTPQEVYMSNPLTITGPDVPRVPSPELLKRIEEVELGGRSPEILYLNGGQVLLLDELPGQPDYPGREENVLRFWIARLAHLSSIPTMDVRLDIQQADVQYLAWQLGRRAQQATRRTAFADDNQLEAAAVRRRAGAPPPPEEEEEEQGQEEPDPLPEEEDGDF